MYVKTFCSSVLIATVLSGCDGKMLEEYSFKKSLEWSLTEKCADDEACVTAVRKLTSVCADRNDWESFLKSQDDPAEKERFVTGFFGCLVDATGRPLFSPDSTADAPLPEAGRTPADAS